MFDYQGTAFPKLLGFAQGRKPEKYTIFAFPIPSPGFLIGKKNNHKQKNDKTTRL